MGPYGTYIRYYCWISNTYYIPIDTPIPKDNTLHQQAEINYYQWVPIILLFMAFCFKVPNIIWHLMNTKSGINLAKICEITDKINLNGKPEDRDESLRMIARHIDCWLRENRNYHRNIVVKVRSRMSNVFVWCCAKREGCYLCGFYLFTKMLYCLNCVLQFYFLDAFLGMDFGRYGFEILEHFHDYGEWKETPRFPRYTLCDFKIRQLQNVQPFTAQCVLPINLFNEKIFAVIWFWLFLVAILSFYNLATWLFFLLFAHRRKMFVKKYLEISNLIQTGFDKKLSRRFANVYLRDDGCFLLHMVGKNSTELILLGLIKILWTMYKNKPFDNRKISDLRSDDEPGLRSDEESGFYHSMLNESNDNINKGITNTKTMSQV